MHVYNDLKEFVAYDTLQKIRFLGINTLAYIYQLTKLCYLMSFGSNDVFKNASYLM